MKNRKVSIILIIVIILTIVFDIYYYISGPYNFQNNNKILLEKLEIELQTDLSYAFNYTIDEEVIVFQSEDKYYVYSKNDIISIKDKEFYNENSFKNYLDLNFNLSNYKVGISIYHQSPVLYAYDKDNLLVFDQDYQLLLDFDF